MSGIIKYVICGFLFWITPSLNGQVFLQLEEVNQIKPYRYYQGQTIYFKSTIDPGEWKKRDIDGIDVEKSLVLTFDEHIPLDQITHFQRRHNWARFVELSLYSFGTTWTILGVLGDIGGGQDFTSRELIIAGSSAALGFIVNKLFYKQNYKIGKKNRLRIIDTNFY